MNRTILAAAFASVSFAACGPAPEAPVATMSSARTTVGTMGAAGAIGAMERLERFGLGEVRGVAYMPGPKKQSANDPAGYRKDDKYTIFYDSDFADADFSSLWGKGDGRGRDDLRRFRDELHVNFVTLYDWSAGVRKGKSDRLRNHRPFLDYAAELGLRVSLPISNYQFDIYTGREPGGADTARANIRRELDEVYGGQSPHKALGMIKVYNEPDNKGMSAAQWTPIVADTLVTIQKWEDEHGIPDGNRLPVFVPVTFATINGLAGGGMSDVHAAVMSRPELGERFWRERMVIAVNPFNDGAFMKSWLSKELPPFLAQHKIPADTPVVFTEYGHSVTESNPATEDGQAAWIDGQFAAIFPPPAGTHVVGAAAFVSQDRPWESGHEIEFGVLRFGGSSPGWSLPTADFDVKVKYWNPNGDNGNGQIWDGVYHVQRQSPRPAYSKIAGHYAR